MFSISNKHPVAVYDFLHTKRASPRLSLQRASVTTDSSGRVLADNSPRLGQCGLELSAARTVVHRDGQSLPIPHSVNLARLEATTEKAPYGADVFNVFNTAQTTDIIGGRLLVPAVVDNDYCMSVFVKKGALPYAVVIFSGYGYQYEAAEVYFHFDSEQLTVVRGQADRAGVIKYPNGWYRLWLNTRIKVATNTDFMCGIYFRSRIPTIGVGTAPVLNSLCGSFAALQTEIGLYPGPVNWKTSTAQLTTPAEIAHLEFAQMQECTVAITYTASSCPSSAALTLLSGTGQEIAGIYNADRNAVPVNRAYLGSLSNAMWVGAVQNAKAGERVTAVLALKAGVWRMVNGGQDPLYSQGTHSQTIALKRLALGGASAALGQNYTGSIERIVVFDKALEQQELVSLYKLLH